MTSAAPSEPPSCRIAFLVGAPRSGTTLLRTLLGAHPEVACPGETGLPLLIAQLARVWYTVCTDGVDAHMPAPPPDVLAHMRDAAFAPIEHFCRALGKDVYCDKSLDAPGFLAAIDQVFPEAQYILAFRHPMDVVVSGLEASRWGFRAFGYAPYVQSSLGNFVAALLTHWLERVRLALDFEEAHGARCRRVRYEDLVAMPGDALASLFDFLQVQPDDAALARAFTGPRVALTPGDTKIAYTDTVHGRSVGRGRTVPIGLVPASLLAGVNEALAALGYGLLDDNWNTATTNLAVVRAENWAQTLERSMPSQIAPDLIAGLRETVAIVVDDVPSTGWVIDPLSGNVDRTLAGPRDVTVVGSARDLVDVLRGETDLGGLILEGRIRQRCDRASTLTDGDASPRPIDPGAATVVAAFRVLQSAIRE